MSTLFSRASLTLAGAIAAMTFSCAAVSDASRANESASAQTTASSSGGTTGTVMSGGNPVDGAPGGMVGSHGMTLFGGADKLYLSHIPLYQAPHSKQVIVEIGIASGVPATGLAQFNTNNFTVKPQNFSLVDLASGTLQHFSGTIYFGNLESGGRPLYSNVKFDVKKVVFQRTMSTSMARSTTLDYIALGTPTNAFLMHLIDASPSFDNVVTVTLPSNSFLDAAALDKGTLVTVTGGVNAMTSRLGDAGSITATLAGSTTGGTTTTPASGDDDDATTTTTGGTTASANSLTVVKEIGCLPGPEFYGACDEIAPAGH